VPLDDPRPVLRTRALRHCYGATVALDGVHLEVAAGECVALLGPNGAGKTTLIRLVTGLLPPLDGEVEAAGGDPRRAATRRHLGVVQQSAGFPRTLEVRELVTGAAIRAGVPRSAAGPAMAEVGLADLARRRSGALSGGQRQRLQLAMALVADPALLLLDEPTVGLDVDARRGFWRTVARRRDRGAGVLLTTHVLDEAASVADRVVVLHRGRVLADDTPRRLVRRLPDRTVSARTHLDDRALAAIVGDGTAERDGELVRIVSPRPEPIVAALLAADPDLTDLRVEGASLEDTLLQLVAATTPEVAA
jgi:ABC-2 type transport system ATP-binding protein